MDALLMPAFATGTTQSTTARIAGVATASPLATEAALEILRAGGNAIDAAVAAAWALCVCEPSASGLGGQTVMLVRLADGRLLAIDGHSRAPAKASLEHISKRQQRSGYRACTVPSTPATLDYVHRHYGVLDRQRVMAPALHFAMEGYALTPLQARQTGWVAEALRTNAAGELYLRQGEPMKAGDLLRQPALARTLVRLSALGIEDFYAGGIACDIVRDMAENGGLIDSDDLASIALPEETKPLFANYRGLTIATTLPPSGGLTLLTALKVLEQLADARVMQDERVWYEAIALATFAALHEREAHPLPPEDLTSNTCDRLVNAIHTRAIVSVARDTARIASAGALSSTAEGPGDTTHLTVADGGGNVVSLTQSIQSVFGAKVASRKLGFVYNNYLCTCERTTRNHPYALGPRCRPRSNAAPLMVLDSGESTSPPLLALGAAGSRRILSSILQVLSRTVDLDWNVADGVAAPRIHALLSRKLWIERPAASETLLQRLRARFGEILIRPHHSYAMGAVQALQFGAGATITAAADPRRDGIAKVENVNA